MWQGCTDRHRPNSVGWVQPTSSKVLPNGGLHPPYREPNASFGTMPKDLDVTRRTLLWVLVLGRRIALCAAAIVRATASWRPRDLPARRAQV